MSGKKNKLKRNLEKLEKSENKTNWKRFLGITLASALTLGAASLVYVAHRQNSPAPVSRANSPSLENYVDGKIERFGNDPNKRDIYIIYQIHSIGITKEVISEWTRNKISQSISACQTSIFRIIESLHATKSVDVIACEGFLYNDDLDSLKRQKEAELSERSKEDSKKNDFMVQHILEKADLEGAILASWVYPNLYVEGGEDPELRSRIDEVKYNINKMRNDEVGGAKINEEAYAKLKQEEKEINRERSLAIVRYGLSHLKRMTDAGIVSGKNLAVIIGKHHSGDYEGICREAEKGKLPYNIVTIVPKHLEESRQKLKEEIEEMAKKLEKSDPNFKRMRQD